MTNASQFGKGAVKDVSDLRNYRMDMVFGATPLPYEYDISDKIQWDKNQNGSSSCGLQAFGYYMEVKSFLRDGVYTKLSAKDPYSHICVQGGGTRAGDILNWLSNRGIAEESDIPSYQNGNPPSENFMTTIQERTPDQDARAMQYWVDNKYLTFSSTDPDKVKQAIFQGDGAVIAVVGNNACWTTSNGLISIPAKGTANWGHFVYLTGWKYINGILHFKFKNSWGKGWGDNGFGYLPVGYLTAGYAYNEWVVVELPKDKYSGMIKMITYLKNAIDALKKQRGII